MHTCNHKFDIIAYISDDKPIYEQNHFCFWYIRAKGELVYYLI